MKKKDRKCVGMMIINDEKKILVGRRIDHPSGFWQMPQGGIDEGENFYQAALRELEEETSIKNVKLIKEIEKFTTYHLPNHLLGIIWKGRYKGQKQKWFIVKFNGDEKEININTKSPEFLDWKWVNIENLTDQVVKFKLQVYKKIKEEIKKVIN